MFQRRTNRAITSIQRSYSACFEEKYGLIIIDTPPEDSPITWAADEAADGILVAVSPREYDYASTTDFMLTISERFKQSPSKGENLRWFKVLAVNVDDKSPYEKIVLDKLVRTVQELFMSANIKNSEAFKAAASRGRTVLDIKSLKSFAHLSSLMWLKNL